MKRFREMLLENSEIEESWTKEDLIQMIQEEDLDNDDVQEITELVIDIIDYGDFDADDFDADSYDWDNHQWDEWDDESVEDIDEKMTVKAKKDAAKRRKKPKFKKAKRLKDKCMKKHGAKVRKTKDAANPMVCGTDGKLKKGMGRADKRKLAKTRKRNKNKIIK